MNIVFEPALREYMRKKDKRTVVVEVVTSNCSDFEVTELMVNLVGEKRAEYFRTKKKFRSYEADGGELLLPPYRLDFDDTLTFGLKSFLGIKQVTHQGIKL